MALLAIPQDMTIENIYTYTTLSKIKINNNMVKQEGGGKRSYDAYKTADVRIDSKISHLV